MFISQVLIPNQHLIIVHQENEAPNSNRGGGGVWIQSQAQPIFNHVFGFVIAQGYGGGVFTSSNTKPTFNNCTFQENEAPNSNGGGGGVYINHKLNLYLIMLFGFVM